MGPRRDEISRLFPTPLTGKPLGSIAMSGRVVDRVAPMKRIIGVSPWAEYVRSTVFKLAAHRSSVLITGPSGTGKELIAQAIHARSPRAAGPLVPVDCAAVPANLFAAQLFGYVKGAFSGANCDTLGCFRAADGGTIFLDEIGELSLEVQSQLLRVVQERIVVPLGSHRGIPVDVRLIAATNRHLAKEVARPLPPGSLLPAERGAYNHRAVAGPPRGYQAVVCGVPRPLGRRKRSGAQTAVGRRAAAPGVLFVAGHVRQLQNILERAALFADAEEIGKADLLPLLDDSRELTAPGESLEEIGEAGLLPLLEPGKIVGGSHARAAVPRAAASRDLPVAAATDSACDGPRVCHASQPACCADREGALPTLAECECRLIQAARRRVRLQQDRGSRHAPRRSPPARARLRRYGLAPEPVLA